MLIWHKLKITLEMIKFEHTVFALPFALIGALLASGGLPTAWQLGWIVTAMVGARSAAMAFNRLADIHYDRLNPRTRERALAKGTLSVRYASVFTVVMSGLFVLSAWELNPLCFYLSFPALGVLFLYSYTKRFTYLSHIVLGFAIGSAPLAAWLAIRGDVVLAPVLLSGAVMFWIAGFDVIYALQDTDFDRQTKLFSLPSRVRRSAGLPTVVDAFPSCNGRSACRNGRADASGPVALCGHPGGFRDLVLGTPDCEAGRSEPSQCGFFQSKRLHQYSFTANLRDRYLYKVINFIP